ncbi:MAG TPA: DUF4112 domain-containing protein [Longimicrobiales bacterium]
MNDVKQARDAAGVRRLAWLLDDSIRIPGTSLRFGIDPLLGLLPGGGDLAGGVLSAYIILAAARLGAPASVLVRMGGNVILDAAAGTIPLLGDLFDAGYKANRRNARLLEQYVDAPRPAQRSSRIVLALVLAAIAIVVVGAALLGIALIRWIVAQA